MMRYDTISADSAFRAITLLIHVLRVIISWNREKRGLTNKQGVNGRRVFLGSSGLRVLMCIVWVGLCQVSCRTHGQSHMFHILSPRAASNVNRFALS